MFGRMIVCVCFFVQFFGPASFAPLKPCLMNQAFKVRGEVLEVVCFHQLALGRWGRSGRKDSTELSTVGDALHL